MTTISSCSPSFELMCEAIESPGYSPVQDRAIEVRSEENNLLMYFMVLASRHPLGKDFWRKATQIGPTGQRLLNLSPEE